jgi:hypothetical protein
VLQGDGGRELAAHRRRLHDYFASHGLDGAAALTAVSDGFVNLDGPKALSIRRSLAARRVTPMSKIFAVIRSRGPHWDHTRPLEQQEDRRAHADFMNALHAEGFVLLGGPLEGTLDVLLIVRAEHPDEITSRFSGDCWTRSDLLRISWIVPWDLRLGSLG